MAANFRLLINHLLTNNNSNNDDEDNNNYQTMAMLMLSDWKMVGDCSQ